MMGEERLREMEERAARATEVPWRIGLDRGIGEEHDVEGPDGRYLAGARGTFFYRADAEVSRRRARACPRGRKARAGRAP